MPVVEETPVDKLPSVTYAADPMVSRFSAIFHMPSVSPEKNRSQSANDTCETAEDIHLIPISEQVESIKKTFESDDSCTERRTSTSTIVQTEDTVSKSNGEVKQSAGATLISSDDGLINIEHPIGSGIISDLEESQIHSSTTDGIIPAERSLTGKERANESSEESAMTSTDFVVTKEFSCGRSDIPRSHQAESLGLESCLSTQEENQEEEDSRMEYEMTDEGAHPIGLCEQETGNPNGLIESVDESDPNTSGIESLQCLIDNIPTRIGSNDNLTTSISPSADGDVVEILRVTTADSHSTTTATHTVPHLRNISASVIVETPELDNQTLIHRETSVISRSFPALTSSQTRCQPTSDSPHNGSISPITMGSIPNRIVDPSSQRLQSYNSSLTNKRPLLPKMPGVDMNSSSMPKRRIPESTPNVVMRGSIPGGRCQVSTMASVTRPILSVHGGPYGAQFPSPLSAARSESAHPVASQNPNLNRLLGSNAGQTPTRQPPQSVISPYLTSSVREPSSMSNTSDNLKSPYLSPSNSPLLSAMASRAAANANSVSYQLPKFHFELPPPHLGDLKIPVEGYSCSECGDSFALRTSLEIHMQRRSVQISVRCLPCDRLLVFYNPCRYKEHIRLHKRRGTQEPIVSPTSYNIKALTDANVRLEVYATSAYKRISNLSALYSHECPDETIGNNRDIPQPTNFVVPTSDLPSIPQSIESRENFSRRVPNSTGQGRSAVSAGAKSLQLASSSPATNGPSPTAATTKEQNSLVVGNSLKCSECSLAVANASDLQLHFAYNLPPTQKQFICQKCQAVYFSSCSFKAHCRIHDTSGSGPFICAECGLSLGSLTSLTSHVLTHRLKPCVLDAWRCTKCYTFYSAWEALIAHVAATHCENFHKCSAPGCAKVFRSSSSWAEHKATDHIDHSCGNELISTCPTCSAVCKDKPQLITHIRKHYAAVSPFQVFRCPLCGRLMENRSGLLTHYRNIHKINLDPGKMLEYRPQLEIANQPVISDTIGTTSTSQQVANTSDSPKFPESVAPIKTSNRSNPAPKLNVELKDQNGDRMSTVSSSKQTYFNCKFCKNVFFRLEDALKKHMEQNHSLSCKTCSKIFETKELRVEDGQRHLREGNPVCLLCENLSFPSQSRLASHLSVHVSGPTFICSSHCNKKFADKNEAINHLRAIHCLIVLACEDCGAMMDSEKSLDVHRWVCRQTKRPGPAANGASSKRSLDDCELEATKRLRVETQNRGAPSHVCAKCGAKLSSKAEFLQHIKHHQQPGFHQCLECGLSFASENSLSPHLVSQHRVTDVANYLRLNSTKCPVVRVANQCDVCHVICNSPADLTSHMRVHGLRYLKAQEKR